MSDDIDQQVAAFAYPLKAVPTHAREEFTADLTALVKAIADANDHEAAATVMLEFNVSHKHTPDYAREVILAAIGQYTVHVATDVPTRAVHAMSMRVRDLVLACRVLGYGEGEAR